jgi:hypothetical protein
MMNDELKGCPSSVVRDQLLISPPVGRQPGAGDGRLTADSGRLFIHHSSFIIHHSSFS